MAACVTLVNVQNILDFVDRKFGLVQQEQYLEAHFVGNGSKKFHVRDDGFSVLVKIRIYHVVRQMLFYVYGCEYKFLDGL